MKDNKGMISKKTFILSFLALIVVCATIVGTLLYINSNKDKETKSEAGLDKNVVTRENSKDKTLEELQAEVDESKIGVEIASTCIYETGSSYGQVNIANTSQNGKSFLVRFVLAETGEEVYKSGRIPPNGAIKTAMLDKPLEKGEYDAVAYFESFTEDGQADGNVGLQIKISVLN